MLCDECKSPHPFVNCLCRAFPFNNSPSPGFSFIVYVCGNEAASPTFLEQNNPSKVSAVSILVCLCRMTTLSSLASRLAFCISHRNSLLPLPLQSNSLWMRAENQERQNVNEHERTKHTTHTCFRTWNWQREGSYEHSETAKLIYKWARSGNFQRKLPALEFYAKGLSQECRRM